MTDGVKVAREYVESGVPMLVLETAKPQKFADTIREAIGAFPQVTLAEGDYVLIARHDGQVYTREFKVESGLNRDVEVIAKAG